MIEMEKIKRINKIKNIYDKPVPEKGIYENDPLCTILFTGKTFAESYFGALKIVDKIKDIIE